MEPRCVTLSIDSASRANAATTEPNDYRVAFEPQYGVYALQVQSAEVPNSQYCVNRSNYVVDFFDTALGALFSATLTLGDYSAAQLATELAAQMNAVTAPGLFTVTANAVTHKLTVTRVAGTTFELRFASGPYAAYTAAAVLGFSAVDTPAAAVQTSDQIVQLQGETAVYLCLEGLGGMVNTGAISDVAAKIVFPTGSRVATLLSLAAPLVRLPEPMPVLRELRVRFVRPNGLLYDFNGLPHTFTVTLWCVPSLLLAHFQ